MHVMLSTHSFLPNIGGVERVLDELARALQGAGHRATIVTNAHPQRGRGFGEEAGLRVFRAPMVSPFYREKLPHPRALRAWGLDGLNILSRAAIAGLRAVELVHAHRLNIDARYCLWLRRMFGIPFVLSLHGGETDLWIERNPERVPFVREMLLAADAITSVSGCALQAAEKLAPGIVDKSTVIRNSVDEEALRRQARSVAPPLPPSPAKRFVTVGQLERWKGIDCVIRAFHRLDRHELVIVGDGPERARLEALRAEGPAASRIHFLGARPYPEALALLQTASALLLPSHVEGCPGVLREARALAIPTIVSDAPPILELARDGGDALVAARADAAAWSEAIERLAADPALREKIVAGGRARLAVHRPAHILAAYLDTYQKARDMVRHRRR